MRHNLYIRHLGPIDECHVSINKFNILTGPQSNGKSTIAKAVYYFRTFKQDILNLMMQGGPQAALGDKTISWRTALEQRMREKFLQIFGAPWIMPDDMTLEYFFTPKVSIRVALDCKTIYPMKDYVHVAFSPDLTGYLDHLDTHSYIGMTQTQKKSEESKLRRLLDDAFETVFIPAGRNLITLLSTQLNYIFTSLEATQLRNIDYVTRRYVELILKLKPMFQNGMDGYFADIQDSPELVRQYLDNSQVIQSLIKETKNVLRGAYRYVDGEERLYLDAKNYVKINFSSSGQQEIVWVLNLLFYYLVEDKRVFLILEEPESHLYPESQRKIGEILGLFLNDGKNAELITTHSPYLLGTFNYMLLAPQAAKSDSDSVKKILKKRCWLPTKSTIAYHVCNGTVESALDVDEHLTLIKNFLIDGASDRINEITDSLIGVLHKETPDGEA